MKQVLLLILAAIFALPGCTRNASKLDYGLDVKETLRINIEQEPPTLDWSKATDTTSAMVIANIMEGLTEYDLKDPSLKLIPALATAWTPSQNSSVWTLTLRPGVKWSDGADFTAQQVLDGWERLLNKATGAEYAYFLFNIKNAKAYNEGKVTDFKEVGAKINDKGQVVVELNQPMSYFPYLLTHHSTYPVRKDLIQKFGDRWTEAANMVSLGAYKLTRWDHDKSLVMERNDGYYGEKAKTKHILAYFINEYSTALNILRAGKLDFQHSLPFKEVPELRKEPGYHGVGILSTYYYGFNTKKAPFDNVKVRQAISYAIDRKQITDLLNAGQEPLTSWIPKGMLGHEDKRGLNFNLAKANELLDEAGYTDRSKFPAITIGFNTNENHQRVAENVQAQLKKNLGISVQLANEEWKVYLNRLKSDAPHIFRMGWLADYPDPDNFLNLITSYSENNYTGWKNPEFDKLIGEGASTTDLEKRKSIYSRAQEILVEKDVPVAPIYTAVSHFIISPRVKNFPATSLDRFLFKGVSLE